MSNNLRKYFFTDFSCGLFGFDIEWQASNSSAQLTKGNQAILRSFQEYFAFEEQIIEQKWVKIGAPGGKAQLGFQIGTGLRREHMSVRDPMFKSQCPYPVVYMKEKEHYRSTGVNCMGIETKAPDKKSYQGQLRDNFSHYLIKTYIVTPR